MNNLNNSLGSTGVEKNVIPVKTGIQAYSRRSGKPDIWETLIQIDLDSRLHGNDKMYTLSFKGLIPCAI